MRLLYCLTEVVGMDGQFERSLVFHPATQRSCTVFISTTMPTCHQNCVVIDKMYFSMVELTGLTLGAKELNVYLQKLQLAKVEELGARYKQMENSNQPSPWIDDFI